MINILFFCFFKFQSNFTCHQWKRGAITLITIFLMKAMKLKIYPWNKWLEYVSWFILIQRILLKILRNKVSESIEPILKKKIGSTVMYLRSGPLPNERIIIFWIQLYFELVFWICVCVWFPEKKSVMHMLIREIDIWIPKYLYLVCTYLNYFFPRVGYSIELIYCKASIQFSFLFHLETKKWKNQPFPGFQNKIRNHFLKVVIVMIW